MWAATRYHMYCVVTPRLMATNGNSNRRTTGATRDRSAGERWILRPKAIMNVTRYTASGMIQRNGTDARFSRIWFVTASMRADGTNAAANQYRRERHDGASTLSSGLPRKSS